MKKAFLQLHISVFLAGFTGVLGKLIHLNEGWLVWYRLLISAATMWVLFAINGKLRRISRSDRLGLGAIGVVAALHWVSFYGSIKSANVSVALVCFSAVGFFTALLEPLILRVRIKWLEVLLGLMVMAGISLIFHFDSRYKTGILMGTASAVFLAIVIIVIRQFVQRINPETVLTYQLTGGLLGLTLILPVYLHWFPADKWLPDLEDLAWLLVLSWLCSVLAFQLSVASLKKLSAFTVNLSYNLEPVYGIALAFLLYRENKDLSPWFFAGIGLIAGSLLVHILLLLGAERRKKAGKGSA